ncbi:hypothetical protein PRIPAC_77192 [Pristionchus pacificus]|uniref:Uncharacterized protein n=1 Tax=Pristionchus pacificus TaxID=54126 RepID=A0A2A6C1Y2_PRIPA|nr:hypothetical protein PRIPAC_77192 [Pristionchus pacificus]|eukprot:PDM72175.1 hypothetical protein PRIPAC_38609 [Pristionchus pacificus]
MMAADILAPNQRPLDHNSTPPGASGALQEEAIENMNLDPINTESNIIDECNQPTVESTMCKKEEKKTE